MVVDRGFWFVLATALISGVSIFLNKFGVAGMDAALFTTGKNVLVALLLISTLFFLKERGAVRKLSKRDWSVLALIGLIGGSLPFLLFFTGLQLTSAAQGSLLHKMLFLWVVVLAALTLKERVSKSMVAGILLLLAGNLVLLKLTSFTFGLGDALILAATLFWAAEIVLSKHLLRLDHVSGRIVAAGRMGFGALFLLAYLFATNKLALVATLSSGAWGWIALTSVLLYGYVFTFYEGLKRVPASVAAALLVLGTVVTTFLEFAWTGRITGLQVLGSALLLAGAIAIVGIRTVLPAPARARQ